MAPPRIQTGRRDLPRQRQGGRRREAVSRRRRIGCSFLSLLADQARRSDWCLLGYSLMTTHYHLILKLRDLTLSTRFSAAEQYLRAVVQPPPRPPRRALAEAVLRLDRRDRSTSVRDHPLRRAERSERANACQAPEDWPWSNYGASIGVASGDPVVDESELLRLFDPRPELARRVLQAMVEETRSAPAAVRRESDSVRRMVLRSEQRNDLVVEPRRSSRRSCGSVPGRRRRRSSSGRPPPRR